jgi:NNP family nitrate/nitrite transporter-like MFS transporter
MCLRPPREDPRQRVDVQDDPGHLPRQAQLEVGAGSNLAEADHRAIRRSGALIGLAGAIGALGGVMVNLAFRQSFLTLKNGEGAYVAFLAFYLVTWAVFMRQRPGRLLGV